MWKNLYTIASLLFKGGITKENEGVKEIEASKNLGSLGYG